MIEPGPVLTSARIAAGALAVLALGGCQTTAEKSAELRKQFHHATIERTGLSITQTSRDVIVLGTTLLHREGKTAVAVTLRNNVKRSLREVPIAITVRGPQGQTVYQNNLPELNPSLTSTSLLLPRQTLTWVDDQVQAGERPSTASAFVGEAPPGPTSPLRMEIRGTHLVEDPANGTGAQGTLTNRSNVTQQNLVIFAVARRKDTIVAAGRAVLATVGPGASMPFEVFFVGNPSGGQLELSAPPSSLA